MSGRRGRPRGSRERGAVALDPARKVAYRLLRAVHDDGAYANLALPELLRERGLAGRDSAFATELAYGALRMRGRYDGVIALCSSRALERVDPRVLDVLRLGAHQILRMNVPDYAAVSASVALVRWAGVPGAAGFVNAVLRGAAAKPLAEWLAELPPTAEADPLGHLAAVESHPRWIADALNRALAADGRDGELGALLAADNSAPSVTLVARPGRISTGELLDMTGGAPGRWSPWAVRISGDPGAVAAVRDGRAAVQDEGSQVIPLALSRAEAPDGPWLDMCAGPGGKAADLAGLAFEAGASLTAVELHPHRAGLVAAAVAGVAGAEGVEVITGDARTIDLPPGFARILLDAPCTGLGAVRRRPELRWRRTPEDLPVLRALQRDLLQRAIDLLAPGGIIAYATCSPHLLETDRVVTGALQRNPGLRCDDARALLPEVGGTGPGPALRLWPHIHDTDGMYLAVLRRDA